MSQLIRSLALWIKPATLVADRRSFDVDYRCEMSKRGEGRLLLGDFCGWSPSSFVLWPLNRGPCVFSFWFMSGVDVLIRISSTLTTQLPNGFSHKQHRRQHCNTNHCFTWLCFTLASSKTFTEQETKS